MHEHRNATVVTDRDEFDLGDLRGELASEFRVADLETALLRLTDPGAASETLHWGRNYLYVTDWPTVPEPTPVVVKQFRNDGLRRRWQRRWRASRAERSWRAARRLLDLGLATPAPVLWADSIATDGPSFYVCEHRTDVFEARYLMRALAAGTAASDYPDLDSRELLRQMGRLARRLHDGGVWHRDLTSGNVLIERRASQPGAASNEPATLYLVDLNRARLGKRLSTSERARDLSRMPLTRPDDRRSYLEGYCGTQAPAVLSWPLAQLLYEVYRRAFLVKNLSKRKVRGFTRRALELLQPKRRGHAHIPRAANGSSSRDKVVWDRLSDQPFQHAGKLEKLKVRILDAPEHLRATGAVLHGLRAWRRYRELVRDAFAAPAPIGGIGVGTVAGSAPVAALVEAVEELGVRHVLIRLLPWEDDQQETRRLIAGLAELDLELVFSVPQTRELVTRPDAWREATRRLAELATPFGRTFQIGQAINRSKWGIWKPSEYVRLFEIAAEELRAARSDVELLGPAVIDFEPHATAAYLNLEAPVLHFEAVASLLYVDRRGAPENPQYGFDLVRKLALVKALVETSRCCSSGRSWVTEVNWPLREGPHSPAGRDVAVDEEAQADYLVRYYLLALTSGLVERVYWWQLAARGYGLMDPLADRRQPRRRAAFEAFRQLVRRTDGARLSGFVGTAGEGDYLMKLEQPDGSELVVGWTVAGRSHAELPWLASSSESRDGRAESQGSGRIELTGSPRYFLR